MTTGKADAYLAIARDNGFIDHCLPADAEGLLLDVIVEVAADGLQPLVQFAQTQPGIGLASAHGDAGSRFLTARVGLPTLEVLESQPFVTALQCAHTIRHQRPQAGYAAGRQLQASAGSQQAVADTPGRHRTLAAVIDHGCPFAHRQFMAGGRTRVVTLWDQDPAPAFDFPGAAPPAGFLDGREVPQAALQQWIDDATLPDGAVDETRCYRLARYAAMDVDLTHGSHVLGRFVGPAFALRGTADDRPAATADIAFVQLPRGALHTPSWAMDRCILDALRYLRQFATRRGYERCVVVCDYGTYLGPHDGTSLFERALDAFMAEPGVRFDVVFPAGNAGAEPMHAVLQPQPGAPAVIDWKLPAQNEAPVFAELWLDEAAAAACRVFVEVGGSRIEVQAQRAAGLPAWLGALRHAHGAQVQVALRAAPTRVHDGVTAQAPAGRLRLHVEASAATEGRVHAYLCWGGGNPGFERPTLQAAWDIPPAHAAAGRIEPRGTLLGSACGTTAGVHVAGGYVDHPSPHLRTRAPYSAIGPGRGPGGASRAGPTCLAMTERASGARGIRGTGTRSGFMDMYMWGTSVAAPQVARALLNGHPLPQAAPGTRASELEERGGGCLA